jgi:hypothetical protein
MSGTFMEVGASSFLSNITPDSKNFSLRANIDVLGEDVSFQPKYLSKERLRQKPCLCYICKEALQSQKTHESLLSLQNTRSISACCSQLKEKCCQVWLDTHADDSNKKQRNNSNSSIFFGFPEEQGTGASTFEDLESADETTHLNTDLSDSPFSTEVLNKERNSDSSNDLLSSGLQMNEQLHCSTDLYRSTDDALGLAPSVPPDFEDRVPCLLSSIAEMRSQEPMKASRSSEGSRVVKPLEYLKGHQPFDRPNYLAHPIRSSSPNSSEKPSSPSSSSTSSSGSIMTAEEIIVHYRRIITTVIHTNFQAVMLLTTGRISRKEDNVDTAWTILGNIISSIPFCEFIGEAIESSGQKAHRYNIDKFNNRLLRNISYSEVDLMDLSSSIAKLWTNTYKKAITRAALSLQLQDGNYDSTIDRMMESALKITESCIEICGKENLHNKTLKNLSRIIRRDYTFTGKHFFISKKEAKKHEAKRTKSIKKRIFSFTRKDSFDFQLNVGTASKNVSLEKESVGNQISDLAAIRENMSQSMILSLNSL